MNDLVHLGAPSMKAVFVNGRSPACWRKQIGRTAARQAALARACAWVDEVVRPPEPSLRSGPLLGSCLSELVEFPPPVGQGEEQEPPRPASSPAGDGRVGRRTVKERGFVPPHRAASGERSTPPQRATAPTHKLHHWAGKGFVSHSSPDPAPRRRARLPAQSSQSAAPPPGAAQNSAQWVHRAVKRTRAQLAQQHKHALPSWPGENMPAGRKAGAPQTLPTPSAPPADLEAQWQQPLVGQRAPLPLLQKLRDGTARAPLAGRDTRPVDARPAQRGGGAGTTAARPDDEAGASGSTGMLAGNGNTAPLTPSAQTSSRYQPPPMPYDHSNNAAASAESAAAPRGPAAAEEAPFELLPRFAPPQLADLLPRLRPLARPGTSNVLPAAAATAENSGRREGTPPTLKTTAFKAAPPDDLDALARQIKQILDEEARRHGIGV